MEDKTKSGNHITSVAEKEIDLLSRHINVLKTVQEHGPIGSGSLMSSITWINRSYFSASSSTRSLSIRFNKLSTDCPLTKSGEQTKVKKAIRKAEIIR